jgi:hypothetical protein
MADSDSSPDRNGKRKKVRLLDGGKVSLRFTGSVDLNSLGTTIVILGTFALLILVVCGVFFKG